MSPNFTDDTLGRYQSLQLKEFLSRPYQYPSACEELSFILKSSYCKFSKNLQTQIFQDTLFAFSLLPEVQMQSAISSANSLLHSAEFALPKQKRALAVKAYKHAVVARKRKAAKTRIEEEGLTMLPRDVLVHIFGFLDLQSLVSAAVVSRLWNAATNDNHLWKILHANFFSNPGSSSKLNGINTLGKRESKKDMHFADAMGTDGIDIDWRNAFKNAYIEFCSKKFKYKRGYCSNCCSIVWLSSNKCSNKFCKTGTTKHHIKTLSTQQIVEYILDGSLASESSDSDGDDIYYASSFKLWAYAYPKRIND